MSTSIIHETILKDIVDLLDDASDFFDDQNKAFGGKDYQFRSLTRNAKNLTLVFPVICTKGISIETASMLTKAIEKYCVQLLQILFASVQITNTKNLQDYISKFHSNMSVGDRISVDDFIDFTDSFTEAAISGKFMEITDKDALNLFLECRNNFGKIAQIALNETSLSDFDCFKDNLNNYTAVLEAKDKNKKPKRELNTEDDYEDQVEAIKFSELEAKIKRINAINARSRAMEAEAKMVEKLSKSAMTSTRPNQIDKDKAKLVEHLSANDVKKANEMMPTKVMVDFYSRDKENGDVVRVERGLIGVKCKLYTVDSLEIIERIATKYADTNWVREIVRATTGEISFWRDFVFALDKARVDALHTAKKGSTAKMFKVLERRAVKNRLGKWKANRADSAPITTLIINQDEVEYLKKDFNINMENRNIAIKLMESYNLMGLFLVDEPAEYASFIWDEGNDASFETMSFRNMERESDDKNYKKVINLMTKISR